MTLISLEEKKHTIFFCFLRNFYLGNDHLTLRRKKNICLKQNTMYVPTIYRKYIFTWKMQKLNNMTFQLQK